MLNDNNYVVGVIDLGPSLVLKSGTVVANQRRVTSLIVNESLKYRIAVLLIVCFDSKPEANNYIET